jgi:type 1 glutamine amidotransferase
LIVRSPRHQITRGLPRSFDLTDEFYEFAESLPSHTRVLLSLDPDSVTDEVGADLPLVWARRYGAGRVFYDALGHLPATWRMRLHRRTIVRGLEWALGDRQR